MSLLASGILGYLKRPKQIGLKKLFGPRPNDRAKAEAYGERSIKPALELGRPIVLDFAGTGLMTQSFFHALLSSGLAPDMRRIERLRVMGADDRQLQALLLALRLMAKTHAQRPKSLEPLFEAIASGGESKGGP